MCLFSCRAEGMVLSSARLTPEASCHLRWCHFPHEVEKGAQLGWWESSRRIEREERELLIWPVGKKFHELASVQQILNTQRHHLSNAGTCNARTQHCADVSKQEAAAGLDWNDLPAPMKLPFEWLARARIPKLNAMVTG